MLPGVGGLIASIPAGAVVYGAMLRLLAAVPQQDAEMLGGLLERLPVELRRLPRLFLGLIAPHAIASETAK
jgi:hypothetical protein